MALISFVFWAIVFALIMAVGVIRRTIFANSIKYGFIDQRVAIKDPTDVSKYPFDIDGVEVVFVDRGTLQLFQLHPKHRRHAGVVVCYGGGDGSPNFAWAERLARLGYETLAVFMYGRIQQQWSLSQVPLEQFEEVLAYCRGIEEGEPITLLAYGKGAEYALNLAVRYDAIDHLVLLAPAAYSFCGLRLNDHSSSWTKKRRDVPCIDQKRSYGFADVLWPMLTRGIVYFRGAYEAAIARDVGREDKRIKVEETDAEILMLAGLDDCVWDSPGMAELVRSHVRHATICSHADAGHLFEGDGFLKVADLLIKNGGTTEGNERASRESADAIEDFLYAHHPELGEA